MAKRARKSYTAQKRTEILAAAQRENLTANDVKRKFGVTPVTYYSWRKKEGLVGRRGRRPSLLTQVGGGGNIAVQVRAGVQAKVRAVMPMIVSPSTISPRRSAAMTRSPSPSWANPTSAWWATTAA